MLKRQVLPCFLSLRQRPRKMSTVSHENLVVSDSSESEEETDSPPPAAENTNGSSPGASQFYHNSLDLSQETDVRFHISKSEFLSASFITRFSNALSAL